MIDSNNRFTADALVNAPTELGMGSEAIEYTVNYTRTINGQSTNIPIAQCKVWITTDATGLNIVASGYTKDLS